jgi:hypothetical protein
VIAGVFGTALAVNSYIIQPPSEEHQNSFVAQAYIAEHEFFKPVSERFSFEPGDFYIQKLGFDANSESLDALVNQLVEYLDLKEGWDGYEGAVPQTEAIAGAIDLANAISKKGFNLPKPMLSSDGEVGLYWDQDGYFVDAGFHESRLFSYFAKGEKIGSIGEDDISPSEIPAKLSDILREISGRQLAASAA